MFYMKEVYHLLPVKLTAFTSFFHDYVLPYQVKNGANLIGSWSTEAETEVIVIWEYPSYQSYLRIEERVLKDDLYQQAQTELQKGNTLYAYKNREVLTSITDYSEPKQKVTVSGYITNESGDTLLVKTYWRSDTWELPGGAVDEGETLDEAVCREIMEETGVTVVLQGVSGVYSNGSNVTVVFVGKYKGGNLQTSDETKEVQFLKLDSNNITKYVKRAKFIPRVRDAMEGKCVPYESFSVRPYRLENRLKGD